MHGDLLVFGESCFSGSTRLQVAELRRQIASASRAKRAAKQRESNCGLNPRQTLVLLAIYILSGDVAVAVEYINAKTAKKLLDAGDGDEKTKYVEDLYLRTAMSEILLLQDPEGSRRDIYQTATRWLAKWTARGFVQRMNSVGVAPSTRQVLEQHRQRSGASLPTTARGCRLWGQRFRRSFGMRLGRMKATKVVDNVLEKVGCVRHRMAAFLLIWHRSICSEVSSSVLNLVLLFIRSRGSLPASCQGPCGCDLNLL